LTKKISRHDSQCTMRPPTVGPSRGPINAGMMMKLIAASSSDFANVRTIARRPTGVISAAPIPCRIRAATSIGTLTDRPHRIEAVVNTATAVPNTRRVPNRSANQPLNGIPTARLRM
jgi:hypothetical protein